MAWLTQQRGVPVHPDHVRRLLRRRRISWQRTVTSVAHKRRDQAAYDAKRRNWMSEKKRDGRGD